MKIVGLIVESHSEGKMSHISNLGPRYHFIKCRKLSFLFFDIKNKLRPK